MQLTLLEIVQSILSKLNSDEVNSIGDTTESMDIALEVRNTFYDTLGNIEWPNQFSLIPFEPSVDITKPTIMKVAKDVDQFRWIKYNSGTASAPKYVEVCYMDPEQFVEYSMTSQGSQSIQTVQDYSGAYFIVRNDKAPSFWTTYDDQHILFDSYDASVDDTLQASKVIAWGQTIPTFLLEDDYIPELPVKLVPLLLAEATAACFQYQKQMASPTDERRARRQMYRHLNNRRRYNDQTALATFPNFGR